MLKHFSFGNLSYADYLSTVLPMAAFVLLRLHPEKRFRRLKRARQRRPRRGQRRRQEPVGSLGLPCLPCGSHPCGTMPALVRVVLPGSCASSVRNGAGLVQWQVNWLNRHQRRGRGARARRDRRAAVAANSRTRTPGSSGARPAPARACRLQAAGPGPARSESPSSGVSGCRGSGPAELAQYGCTAGKRRPSRF